MMERHGILGAPGTLALWLAAGVLAAIWFPQLHANEAVPSGSLARPAHDGPPAEAAAQMGQDHQAVEILERELASTKRDMDVLLKLLPQESERASRLEQDLAAARREAETQTALARKAGEEAAQLKQTAEKSSAKLRQLFQQERDKAEALAQELSNARAAIYAYDAKARQASDQAAELKEAAETGTAADLKKSLQQERERAKRLEQDLVAARRDVETQTALATKANEDTARSKETAEYDSAELQRSLQKEHERAEALAQNLSMVLTAISTYEVQVKASDQTADWQQGFENSTVVLRKSLQQEQERAEQLEQDLAVARRDVETQTALAAKNSDETAQLRRASESGFAELRQSLQQERERTAKLERDLALTRSNASTLSNAQREVKAAKPVAAEQAAASDTQPRTQDAAITRLMSYAGVLLDRGDISSARTVLERAAEMGSAQANFRLAETYDPLVLSKWGTYGTRGDSKKAVDLYTRALAGGITEAKERSAALLR